PEPTSAKAEARSERSSRSRRAREEARGREGVASGWGPRASNTRSTSASLPPFVVEPHPRRLVPQAACHPLRPRSSEPGEAPLRLAAMEGGATGAPPIDDRGGPPRRAEREAPAARGVRRLHMTDPRGFAHDASDVACRARTRREGERSHRVGAGRG